MNAYAKNARAAYMQNDLKSMSREEIVVKLYQALRIRLHAAIEEIREGNIGKKAEHLSRCLAIVCELRASLDMEQGGEIAVNLNDLYSYLASDIIAANLKSDVAKIEDALKVVAPLLEAWTEIAMGKKPKVRAAADSAVLAAVDAELGQDAINY